MIYVLKKHADGSRDDVFGKPKQQKSFSLSANRLRRAMLETRLRRALLETQVKRHKYPNPEKSTRPASL